MAGKPAFRRAFRDRRCLVLADGFYEWKKELKGKRPFYIRMRNSAPFAFAGIWERWEGSDGTLETCAILTTTANMVLAPIHDRMPVILPVEGYPAWLDPAMQVPEPLSSMFLPIPDDAMEAYPVGTTVNNPKIEDPRCIVPADSTG